MVEAAWYTDFGDVLVERASRARRRAPSRAGLARGVSAVATALLAVACLDTPPTYEALERIPPLIVGDSITPDPSRLVVLEPGQSSFVISLRYRSEDLGQEVLGFAFLDLGPGPSVDPVGDVIVLSPGGFDEVRALKQQEVTDLDNPGCHTVTLVLTHSGNVLANGRLVEESNATRVVWWLQVKDADDESGSLTDCPVGGELPQ